MLNSKKIDYKYHDAYIYCEIILMNQKDLEITMKLIEKYSELLDDLGSEKKMDL